MAILTWLAVRAWRTPVATGASGMVGSIGTALSDLAPEGRVFVRGEYWNARARAVVRQGARVRVTAVHDLVVEVEETT
jgi:membrane-bound serine protease (ClpP class)